MGEVWPSPWLFGGKPILLQKWKPGFQFDRNKIRTLPVWARLHGCRSPMEQARLSLAASMVGLPIACDEATLQGHRWSMLECVLSWTHQRSSASFSGRQPHVTYHCRSYYEWKPIVAQAARFLASCKVTETKAKEAKDAGNDKEMEKERGSHSN
uniref:Uncharacterized protein n=1 Tax=Salix viminalis TaxID=40686 RepID=A0A6N2KMY6_SALVM